MRLSFLGTGAAFTIDNFQSNMILEVEGSRLLIDCGGDARRGMRALGLSHLELQGVYISHLHNDHIGGLEWLAFSTYFDPRYQNRPLLFICEDLIDPLWQSLRGGLESMESFIATLETYFEVRPIKPEGSFTFGNVSIETIKVFHYLSGGAVVPSYGLRWPTPSGKQVFLSTDVQFRPDLLADLFATTDILFHDCETAPFRSGVHANYLDLKTLPPEIKRKMYLYHYQDGKLPDALADGFAGFVAKGQTFEW